MSFDGRQFGREIVALVKEYVEAQTAPLHQRIADLTAKLEAAERRVEELEKFATEPKP